MNFSPAVLISATLQPFGAPRKGGASRPPESSGAGARTRPRHRCHLSAVQTHRRTRPRTNRHRPALEALRGDMRRAPGQGRIARMTARVSTAVTGCFAREPTPASRGARSWTNRASGTERPTDE